MQIRRWLRRAVVAAVVVLAASAGFSRLLRVGRVHRHLNARLEAAFGRPVEVGRFAFSLLDGPRLQAESVTVAEDPRFGREYFLRAERLTASPRWRLLAHGRFEFGTLSFTRPSLNLVRAADGHWNIESWLPPPARVASAAIAAQIGPGQPPAGVEPPTRLYRIEVDTGRINFKQGVDKHPFALVEVKGVLEQESAGRWRLDLEARPLRAAVTLQEAGTLRVRGRIAGTSARLQPADLVLTWQDASLADALRLARGKDYGVRGRLQVEINARSEAPGAGSAAAGESAQSEAHGARWSLAGTARLTDAHRWDLPKRPGDPALNLSVQAQWRTGDGFLEFSECLLEAPRSSVRTTGKIQWAPSLDPQLRLVSSKIDLADLLAWYRAFRPGVAEDVVFEGDAGLDLALSGWPPRLERGAVLSDGARLQTAALPRAIRAGRVAARVARGRLVLEPITITLDASPPGLAEATSPQLRSGQARKGSSLRVEGAIGPGEGSSRVPSKQWRFDLSLTGQTDRAEDLLAAAAALGHSINRGWRVEGPAGLSLRWQGTVRPFQAQALTTLELHGLRLQTVYLNQPVIFADARIELRPGERRAQLNAVQAFGARWKGTLRRLTNSELVGGLAYSMPWEFDLTADHLDATELDRWLGPRARPGLLERLISSGAASRESAELDAAVSRLRAQGQIQVEEIVLSPLRLRRLRAGAELEGRKLTVRQVQAEFYGGMVKGSLRADLLAEPAYRIQAQFERANLGSLVEAAATLKGRFAGVASGELELAASGVGRENLRRSLEGRGTLHLRGAEINGLDLRASYTGDRLVRGPSRFAAADAQFSLAAASVRVMELRLADREDDFEAAGTVDFSRTLDLRIRRLGPSGERPSKTVRITGPLDAPQVSRIVSPQ